MADSQIQVSTPLLKNIEAQGSAFEEVAAYQLGPGLAAIERAAGLIQACKRVVLTGMGASLFACIPFRYELARRGIDVSVVETGELLYFLQAALDPETVVVLVSRSGESVEVLKLLAELRSRRCRTIGITNEPASTLAVHVDQSILMHSPADQLVAIQSYLATLFTLAMLSAACLGEVEALRAETAAAGRLLGQWVSECVAASERWQSLVAMESPVYLLSRGPGLAVVEEGVLLMHEVAKSPAVGMSIAQFRHGFVEASDARLRAILIGTQAETAEIDRQLALDLARMGAHVAWVGPLPAGSPIEQLCEWPDGVPERFVPLFATVPLQMFAYRSAEARGFTPGVFRWASTITGSESGFPGLDGGHD